MDEFAYLVSRLALPDEAAVIDAAQALGEVGDAQAVPILIELLETTTSPRIRNAAAMGLRDLGDARAVPALMRQLTDPTTRDHRGTLVWALEPLDARSAIAELADVMCGDTFEGMQMTLFVYEALPDPLPRQLTRAAIARLQRCVADEHLHDWQQRFLAAAIELLEERRG